MDTRNQNEHWPPVGTGLWTRWWGYLVRWLVFGVVVSVFQPVGDDLAPFWPQKGFQAAWGALFGSAGAILFTLAENRLNTPRVRWKTWALVVATWVIVKTIFVTAMALA